MKVDKFELQKQRKEEIKKTGKYIRLEIIVPNATTSAKCVEPIVEFETEKTNTVTMWCLYNLLDSIRKTLIEKDPNIKLAEMIIGTNIIDMGTTKKRRYCGSARLKGDKFSMKKLRNSELY